MLDHDLDRRERILGWSLHAAALAAMLATLVAAYALALRPMSRQRLLAEERAAFLDERIEDVEALRAQRRRLAEEVAEIERRIARCARRVPAEPSEAEFLSQIADAAAGVGLKIGDYRPGVVRAGAEHSHMEIQISCLGPYRSLCGFLDRLESLQRLSQVVQIDVRAGPGGDCAATITLAVYFRAGLDKSQKGTVRG